MGAQIVLQPVRLAFELVDAPLEAAHAFHVVLTECLEERRHLPGTLEHHVHVFLKRLERGLRKEIQKRHLVRLLEEQTPVEVVEEDRESRAHG